jgi:hypothetical protein
LYQSYRTEELIRSDTHQATEPPDDLFQPKRPDAGKLFEDLLLAIIILQPPATAKQAVEDKTVKATGSYPIADKHRQFIKLRQHFLYRFAGHQDLIAMQGQKPDLLIGPDLMDL